MFREHVMDTNRQAARSQETRALMPTLGLLPVVALSAAAVAAPSFAQEATTLDTVVVEGTAVTGDNSYSVAESSNEKVLTPLVDTPKTITVITQREMTERGQTSLEDIVRTTPGITLTSGEGGNPAGFNPTIRGNSASNDVMVDGFRSNLRTDYETFNLESVEITKGPGGTAAGVGSTGGTINMVSKMPLPGQFDDVSATLGTGAYKRFTLDSNRQFGDVGARLNLMYQDADSLGGRDGRTSKRYGIAPSVSYQLGEATKLTAGLYYFRNKDMMDYGVPWSNATTPDAYRRGSGTADDPWQPVDVPTDAYYGIKDRDKHDAESKSVFLRVDHDFSPNLRWSSMLRAGAATNHYVVTVPSATATGVSRSSRQSNRSGNDVQLNSQLTGEAAFLGTRHTYALGVDLSDSEVRAKTIQVTPPPGFDNSTGYTNPDSGTDWAGSIYTGDPTTSRTKYRSYGIYAFDVFDLAPQWQMSFGLRYDKYDAKTTTAAGEITENNSNFWNSNIGLNYKPAENGSIYASIGTSSNPAGEANGVGTGTNADYKDLEPERAYSYEIGTKWTFLDDQLLVTAAVFKTDKRNARALNAYGEYENIGKTRTQGVELGVAGQITDKWGISAGYTYTDAKTLEAGYTCTGGECTPNSNTGARVIGIPLNTLAIWTTYAVTDQWTVGGGLTYMDERPMNAARTAVLPEQTRVDLMTSYELAENTRLQLNINNVFDEQLYSGTRANGFANVEPGRNVSVSIAHRF
ncbi:TonB-dependent siderophore receptor [Sinirhodobacter populi]|uniref:TonB-dependent siderophore receptor n=2 Tax=Paenirhodobacter populi TaxID=2306993 RepID=A0A443JKH9_9RHOB|nr:TonB-dependent siderophore receptor [Sinirhodobacter populi]